MLSLYQEPTFQANLPKTNQAEPVAPRRLLILENKVNISRALAPFCRIDHYELFSVSNGLECRAFLLSERPDLVIIDAKLADSTIAAMMHWRNQSRNPAVIIMLGQESDRQLSQALGVDDFIKRPIRPIELIARLRFTLQQLRSSVNTVAPPPEVAHESYF